MRCSATEPLGDVSCAGDASSSTLPRGRNLECEERRCLRRSQVGHGRFSGFLFFRTWRSSKQAGISPNRSRLSKICSSRSRSQRLESQHCGLAPRAALRGSGAVGGVPAFPDGSPENRRRATLRAKDCTPEIAKMKCCWKMPLKIHRKMPLEIHDDF